VTLGTPVGLFIANQDVKKVDYDPFKDIPRPGHADYTYLLKYGIKAESGGGRSSARETTSRVAAGAIACKILEEKAGTLIVSWVNSVGTVRIPDEIENEYYKNPPTIEDVDTMGSFESYERKKDVEPYSKIQEDKIIVDYQRHIYNKDGEQLLQEGISLEELNEILSKHYTFVEKKVMRCPHTPTALKMMLLIQKIKEQKDSIGGVISTVCSNVPSGLGEPCFDKLEAVLAHAMLSIPATKGFEIGSGFEGTKMQGSQHNDLFTPVKKEVSDEEVKLTEPVKLSTKTNFSGGTLGGISSGENIYFKVAFKPVSTISLAQETADFFGNATVLEAKGRHDPCVLPRAPPIVEAMASLVLVDAFLIQTIQEIFKKK